MTKEELQALHLTVLAVRCREVADDASFDSETRDKALEFVLEWNRLPKFPITVLAEKKVSDAQQEGLKNRVVDFLAYL
jgi:hypothetical protein